MNKENEKSKFMTERTESSRYGTDILKNFDVDGDLAIWEVSSSYSTNGTIITLVHPEVAALCPLSGYPDSGKITIKYIPKKAVVELKAFKLWINSYRDEGISHEGLANEVYSVLRKKLDPVKLSVVLEMAPRGNITTIVEVGDKL